MNKVSWLFFLLKRILTGYLILAGIAFHMVVVVAFIIYPDIIYKLENKVSTLLYGIDISEKNINHEIKTVFGSWKPLNTSILPPQKIVIGKQEFADIKSAVDALKPGDILELGSGIYKTPLVIRHNHVTLIGRGHVVFDGPVAESKGAILVLANDFRIINIECKGINVSDKNGACIRLEGANLTVDHVFFHDSQEGILTGNQPEKIIIRDSRFELLGHDGQAHGIYTNGGELFIEDSLFIAAVSEGHEIKSRSKITEIVRTVVASLGSEDSRLVDAPNGGFVSIRDSVLEKGPGSSNADTIGYGLEGIKYNNNFLELKNNIIILERNGQNNLIHYNPDHVEPLVSSNVIISTNETQFTDFNLWYKNRKKANLDKYPYIPNIK